MCWKLSKGWHATFKVVKGIDTISFDRMSYADAMKFYGSDKPDTRFGMRFVELNELAQNKGFKVFDDAQLVAGINAEGCSEYTRKQLDELTDWVKRPQMGAKGMVYVKYNTDGTFKSSIDKFTHLISCSHGQMPWMPNRETCC
jgi:aspartyl-tRNA synthetase